jgi:quercetin dioxygenase-like cupin family protein
MITIADSDVLAQPYPPVTAMPPRELLAKQRIEELRQFRQVDMPLTHRFQDGVYIREISMPKGAIVVGHVHKTRHQNIVLTGKAMVSMNGGACKTVKAGDVFESDAGVQKWLYIEEDCRWLTIHANPANLQDVAFLEERLLELSPEFLAEKGSRTIDEVRMSVNQLEESAA